MNAQPQNPDRRENTATRPPIVVAPPTIVPRFRTVADALDPAVVDRLREVVRS